MLWNAQDKDRNQLYSITFFNIKLLGIAREKKIENNILKILKHFKALLFFLNVLE